MPGAIVESRTLSSRSTGRRVVLCGQADITLEAFVEVLFDQFQRDPLKEIELVVGLDQCAQVRAESFVLLI